MRKVPEAQLMKRRDKVIALCEAFPDGRLDGDQHLSIYAGKKRYGYLLHDHHGDGRFALNLRAPLGDQDELVELDPVLYHVPAYLGPKGWIGVWLDLPKLDFKAVTARLEAAYRMTATKGQLERLEEGEG